MSGFAPDPAKLSAVDEPPAAEALDASLEGEYTGHAGDTPQTDTATHAMEVGPTQAFDGRGVARTVWALKCSCGHAGKAIDESGIGREARVHGLEVQQIALMQIVGELADQVRQIEGSVPVTSRILPMRSCDRCGRDEADECGVIVGGVCMDCTSAESRER